MYRIKAFFMDVLSVIIMLAPLAIFILAHKDVYLAVNTKTEFYIGTILAIGLGVLMVSKAVAAMNPKFKFIIGLSGASIAAEFLKAALADLHILLPLITLGYVLFLIPNHYSTRYKRLAMVKEEQWVREEVKDTRKVEPIRTNNMKGRY